MILYILQIIKLITIINKYYTYFYQYSLNNLFK